MMIPEVPETGGRQDRRGLERMVCSKLACSCFVRSDCDAGLPGSDSSSEKVLGGAILSNISPLGISFESNFQPSEGQSLCIEVRPIEGPELSARISVIHSKKSDKNGFYMIGSRFEDISERDRQSLLMLIDTIHRLRHDLSQA